jgi:hypothetical protein
MQLQVTWYRYLKEVNFTFIVTMTRARRNEKFSLFGVRAKPRSPDLGRKNFCRVFALNFAFVKGIESRDEYFFECL